MVKSVRTVDTNPGDHRVKVYGLSLAKTYKKTWRKTEAKARTEKTKPIAVSKMRGRSDEERSKREEVAEKIQESLKECKERDLRDGEMMGQDKVLRMMGILRESAEEVVGRELNQKLAPFMDSHIDEMKEKTREINELFRAVLTAKTKPEEDRARKERNSATAAWRKTKRTLKAA